MDECTIYGTIAKFADDDQRMVYGWANVTAENGQEVVDLHGDIIPTELLEKAATDFMLKYRHALSMHAGGRIGTVVHSLPVTPEIAKALGIETARSGWIIGMKVDSAEVWAKVKSGDYRGFSIGGFATKRETEE